MTLLACICGSWQCLVAQAQMESSLAYRRYTTQDGLPQVQTERLWQDSRGYIYVGTLSGFVRFDGRSFTPFLKGRRINIVGFAEVGDSMPSAKTPGYDADDDLRQSPPGEVRALGFFRQWRVGYDELQPMPLDSEGHWLLNNLNAGSLPNGYVLMEDSLEEHRRLCLLTKSGLKMLLEHPLLDEMTPDRKLFVDNATGSALVPTGQGLFSIRLDGGDTLRISAKTDIYTLQRMDMTVRGVAHPAALLAFASDGIYAVEGDSLRHIAPADWTAASYGLTVRQLKTGGVAVADEHSVYLWEGDAVCTIAGDINLVRDILIDRWDRLWVATYQGLYCFFNRCFTIHRLTDKSDIVRAVATDGSGRLLMGTLNGKLMAVEQTAGYYPQATLLSDDPDQFFAPSAARIGNDVYMAGNGDLLRITDGGDTLRWAGLPRDRYQFVAQAWGRVITANRNTVFAYNPATAALDTLITQILHPWCAATDGSGCLWVGGSSGLFCIAGDGTVSKAEYGGQKLIVSTITADKNGNIFFASADSLFVIDDGSSSPRLPASTGQQLSLLGGHEIRALHASPLGYLVIAVIDGLFVARINDGGTLGELHFFNHLNGFTITEPLKTVMAETADGTVWLPGVEQMASFSPAALLAIDEADTYIYPPLPWWQHWWVWTAALAVTVLAVWAITRWYEKRRSRRRMIRLQSEKMKREELIREIRQKAEEEAKAKTNELANDIVNMTEKTFGDKLTLRTASGTISVDVNDIAFFKGDGNYSKIVTFHGKDTVLMGLGTLEKMLQPDIFVRADRSTLLNIHHVGTLLPRQRRCIFRSPEGIEVETTLLAPAFKRVEKLLL